MPEQHRHLAYTLRLDVAAVDPAPVHAARRRLAEQGITLTTLAAEQARDPQAWAQAYAVHNECRRRQPPIELRQTPIPPERWLAAFVNGSDALPDGYFIAVEGQRAIGVSVVHRAPSEPDVLIAGFTGVLVSHAGRGIGLGLKLATVAYAQAHQYRVIRTGVLAENVPMLRINEAVGFQRQSEELTSYTY
jgi:mycothiol synthase